MRFWTLTGGSVLFCTLLSCGGSGEPAPATASNAQTEVAAAPEPTDAVESEAQPPAKVDDCADGTCSHCGEAVCLTGFYCDESVNACAWVPACAKEPSCECLQQALPGCRCELRDNAPFVRCD
jgi:hypothetical protein